jgi:hypothetical protein
MSNISEMARLMDIMNGKKTSAVSGNVDAKTDSMKKILEAFYGMSANAVETAKEIKEVREAYLTEETATGVKIANWYIDCSKQSNLKTYSIREEYSSSYLVHDLVLYEAAYGLVKLLLANEGLESNNVNMILKLESDYSKFLNDAINYKHMLSSKNLNESKRAILEDRYESAKYSAVAAKNRIMQLYNEKM